MESALRHTPLDAGAQDLHRHLAPVGQPCRMRLRQRGGGDRGPNSVNRLSTGRPSERSISRRACSTREGGRVLQVAQVRANSTPKMSARVART
jgi:hypothetical protein